MRQLDVSLASDSDERRGAREGEGGGVRARRREMKKTHSAREQVSDRERERETVLTVGVCVRAWIQLPIKVILRL